MKKVHLQEKICQNWIAMARMAAILDLCKLEKTLKGAKPAPGGFSLRNTLAPQIHQKIKVIPQFQVQPKNPLWLPDYGWSVLLETDVGLVSGGLNTKLRRCRSRVVSVMSRPTVGWSGHQKPARPTHTLTPQGRTQDFRRGGAERGGGVPRSAKEANNPFCWKFNLYSFRLGLPV